MASKLSSFNTLLELAGSLFFLPDSRFLIANVPLALKNHMLCLNERFEMQAAETNCCHYDFAGLVENLENLVFGPRATDSAIKSGKAVFRKIMSIHAKTVRSCIIGQ